VAQGENRGSVEQRSQLGFDVSEGFHDRAYHLGPPVCEKWCSHYDTGDIPQLNFSNYLSCKVLGLS
jgi:hypothetical protein